MCMMLPVLGNAVAARWSFRRFLPQAEPGAGLTWESCCFSACGAGRSEPGLGLCLPELSAEPWDHSCQPRAFGGGWDSLGHSSSDSAALSGFKIKGKSIKYLWFLLSLSSHAYLRHPQVWVWRLPWDQRTCLDPWQEIQCFYRYFLCSVQCFKAPQDFVSVALGV